MRLINMCKELVKSNFPGYYYPIFSLVIIHEDGKNIMGRIIGYKNQDSVVVQSKSGAMHTLKYHEVVFYEDPHRPVMTLKEVEKLAHKIVNKYSKTPVNVDDKRYLLDLDLEFKFSVETYRLKGDPDIVACTRNKYYDPGSYHMHVLLPFLQYSSKKQIIDILLHETAHLLAIDEDNGHGDIWRDICLAIGGNGRAKVTLKDAAHFGVRSMKMPADWKAPADEWNALYNLLKENLNIIADVWDDFEVGFDLLSTSRVWKSNLHKTIVSVLNNVMYISKHRGEGFDVSHIDKYFYVLNLLVPDLYATLDASLDGDDPDPNYTKAFAVVTKLNNLITNDFKDVAKRFYS